MKRMAEKAAESRPPGYVPLTLSEEAERFQEWLDECIAIGDRIARHREDEAAGIVRKCGLAKIRVCSVAKLPVSESPRPRPDPAAPKVKRVGRRSDSAATASPGMPITEDGIWKRGI
jgi:hypothetical protein